mgnify:FL=1
MDFKRINEYRNKKTSRGTFIVLYIFILLLTLALYWQANRISKIENILANGNNPNTVENRNFDGEKAMQTNITQ